MVKAGEVDTASEAYEILAEKYDGVAITAAKAAQEAKTFQEALDATKDAVSSGWMKTFELIFGDYSESKVFWTDLANILWDIFASGAEDRNAFLSEALDSNWDQLISKIQDAGIETSKFEESIKKIVGEEKFDGFIDEWGSLEKAIKNGAISSEELKKALSDAAGPSIESIISGLEEVGHTLRRGSIGTEVEKIQAALDKLGYDLGKYGVDGNLGPMTQKAIKAFQKANDLVVDGIAGPKTLAALKTAAGELEGMTDDVDELMASCDSLIDVITDPSGRELIFDSIINILEAIQRPIAAVGEAFRNVFSLTPKNLYNGLKKINNFTKSLLKGGILDSESWDTLTDKVNGAGIKTSDFIKKLSETLKDNGVDVDELRDKYGSLGEAFEKGGISADVIRETLLSFDGISETLVDSGENVDKIRRTFEGLFATLKLVASIVSGPIKLAFNVITSVLKHLGLSFLDVTAGIGDRLVRLQAGIEKVTGAISDFVGVHVAEWIKQFRETEFFKTVAGWFKDTSKNISDSLGNIVTKIKEFDTSKIATRLEKLGKFFSDLAAAIGNSKVVTAVLDGIRGAFGQVKAFFGKFKLPEFNIDNLKKFATDIVNLGSKIAPSSGKGPLAGIANTVTGFGEYLKGNVIGVKWTSFKEKTLEKFVTFWLKTGDKVKAAFEKLKEVFKAIVKFIFGTEQIDLPVIMDLVTKFLWIVTLIEAIKLLENIVSPFDNLTDALDNLATSLKWDAIAGAFKSMALALGVFTVCILVLTQMPDMKKAWHAVGMMAVLMIVMGGLVTLMGWVAGKAQNGLNTAGAALSLLMLVGALAIIVHTLKEIDKLKLKNPGKTFVILGAILLTLTAGVRMISAAGGSSFRSVAAILTLMAALKLILDVLDAYDNYDWAGKQKAIERMLGMLFALSAAIRIASGGTQAGASSSGLALTLIAMVISLKLLLDVIEDVAAMDTKVLLKGGSIVAGMLLFLTGMLAVINLTSKNRTILQKGERAVNNFAGLALALLAVVAAIWILGKMDYETLKQGGLAVGQVLLLFTGMLAVLGKSCSGLKMGSIIAMMVMIAIIMAETAIIIKELDGLSLESKFGTVAALGGLLLIMATALRIMSSYHIDMNEVFAWTVALGVLTVVLYGLAGLMTLMSGLDPLGAIAHATALGGLLAAMAGVLYILGALDMRKLSTKKMTKIGLIFAGMVAVLASIGLVLAMMSALNVSNALANAAALSILITVLTGVLTVLSFLRVNKGTYAAVGAIALLGAVVLELGYFLHLMDGWNIGGKINDVLVLSAMLTVLTGVMAICAVLGGIAGASWKGMGVCVIALGLLGAIVLELGYFLHVMDGWNIGSKMEDVKVLSALLLVLTGVMAAISALSLFVNPGGAAVAILGIALLGTIVLELGYFLHLMEGWNIGNMLPTVKVISALLAVLTGVMAAVSVLSLFVNPGGAAVAIVGIALLGAIVLELGFFLHLMEGWNVGNMLPTVTVISALLTVLTGVMAAITVLSLVVNPGGAVTAILGIALLGAVVLELGYFLHLMEDWNIGNMAPTVKVLSILLMNLTGVLAVLTVIGFFAPAAIAGTTALVTMIAELEVLILAIGAVMSIPGLTKFLDVGIESLKKLAQGIGEIISAFGVGLTSGLPAMGTNLSDFATELETFITVMSDVDDNLPAKVGLLAAAVAALSGTGFINSITNLTSLFTTGSGTPMADLAEDLGNFGEKIGPFIEAINGIDDGAVTKLAALSALIQALNDVCRANDWASLALGDTSIATFGQDLAAFAKDLKVTADELGSLTDEDVENVKRGAAAGAAMAELNACLPREGGLLQGILGEQKLDEWGKKINAFADSLLSYSAKVSGSNIDTAAIKASADAAMSISDLNNAIPKDAGLMQAILGEQELAIWGSKISSFATSLVNYSNKVSGQSIKVEAIKASVKGATAIAGLNKAIPPADGFWQWITGEKDLSKFGTGIGHVADGLLNYAQKAVEINAIGIEPITQTEEIFKTLAKLVGDHLPTFNSLFSSTDPVLFGDGLSAIANGMQRYCTVAATIDQSDLDAITNSEDAIEMLKDVVENVPDVDSVALATLNTAITRLQESLNLLNAMSSAEYNFSGIPALKQAITDTLNLFSANSGIDPEGLKVTAAALSGAAADVVNCSNSLTALNDKSYGGVSVLLTALENLASAKVDAAIENFSGKAVNLQNAVGAVVTTLETSLGNTSGVSSAATGLAQSALTSITSKKDEFRSAGKALADNLQSGMEDQKSLVTDAAGILARDSVNAVRKQYDSMKLAGSYLVDGFAAGITARTWYAEAKAKAMANAAEKAAKAALDINSPSKVFRAIGYSVPEGFAMGIDRMTGMAVDSAENMATVTLDNVKNAISNVASLVESDIDSQPTIRPVLDLSDVRSGVGTLDSMLRLGSTVGVSTNIGAISTMMNRRSQNGVNDEVVSAINKLRKDLGNVGGTTYQINGVTYDDGSNISDAVKTIVRAARIERRV